MEIKFSKNFGKQFSKIDRSIKIKIVKALKKLKEVYKSKKHLKNILKGQQTIRIKPFRIIFEIKENKIEIISFGHRDNLYKE